MERIWDDMGDHELKTRIMQRTEMTEASAGIVVKHVRDGCETCQTFVEEELS